MPEAGDSQRRACSITPAATCTDGPCRPTDKPASSPPDTPSTLAALSFKDTKRERSLSGVSGASAVSTWGTPDPTAPGAQRRMVQTIRAVRAGVQSKGAHHQPLRRRLYKSMAASASRVKPTTARPASTAYAITTARSSHCLPPPISSRRFCRKSGSPFMGWQCRPWGIPAQPGLRQQSAGGQLRHND